MLTTYLIFALPVVVLALTERQWPLPGAVYEKADTIRVLVRSATELPRSARLGEDAWIAETTGDNDDNVKKQLQFEHPCDVRWSLGLAGRYMHPVLNVSIAECRRAERLFVSLPPCFFVDPYTWHDTPDKLLLVHRVELEAPASHPNAQQTFLDIPVTDSMRKTGVIEVPIHARYQPAIIEDKFGNEACVIHAPVVYFSTGVLFESESVKYGKSEPDYIVYEMPTVILTEMDFQFVKYATALTSILGAMLIMRHSPLPRPSQLF